jgi:RHS repeat-associated protein
MQGSLLHTRFFTAWERMGRRRWRGRLATALAVAVTASLQPALDVPQPASAAPPAAPAKTACPDERPDEMAALITARMCGGRVEVGSRRSERMRMWAEPSGSLYVESTLEPEWIRDPNGKWVKVDVTLERHGDGSVAPKAHPNSLTLAGAKPAGDNDLATLRLGKQTLTLGWRGSLPEPVLSGTTATYREVRPGIDLVVEATRTSYLYSLVVKDRAAASGLSQIAMPWRTGGLTAVSTAGGGLELRDRKGGKVARVAPAQMWDAVLDGRSGEHLHRSGLGMKVDDRRGGQDLVLSPSRAFLDDPHTQYPVTIDPGPWDFNPNFDTYVESDTTTDVSGSTELRVGTFNSGGTVARSFLSFWLGGFLHGATVQSAYLFLWNFHSWSCTPELWQLYFSPYVDSSLRWSNQPGIPGSDFISQSSQTLGASGCGQNWVWTDAASGVQRLADDWTSSTVNFRIHAASETNNLYWKKFYSAQGTVQPILRITYTMKPTVAAVSTAPATQCLTGSGRPFINTTTPTLRATVNDAEGASVSASFEWWNTGGSLIGSATTAAAASGSTLATTVPSGALANGGTYSWRVRGGDGITASDWSPWCEFTVDNVAPGSAPGVSSTTYPAGAWSGNAGTAGNFTFSPSGVSDIASYRYGLDENPPTTTVAAPSLGASATVSITPTVAGPHTLYVQALDRAGNASPTTTYQFNVGVGAVLSPKTGDVSAAKFSLEALAPSGATAVTYEWRRGDADAWTTIPTSDVTYAAGGGPVTWPQPSSGAGAFAKLNWDVAKTLNDAESGAEPRDGPLQIHAVFTGPSTTSDPVKVTFDLNRGWAAATKIGPGSVNLLTGNLVVGQTDVSAFGLGLARSFNTRQAADVDALFGPGWISSAPSNANWGYTGLTVTGSLVQIGLPDGNTLGFTQHDTSNTTFDPQVGFEEYTLTRSGSPAAYTLVDPTGSKVVFTQPTGAAAGVYAPSSSTPVGSTETTAVSWELVPGSTTLARPTRILAPVPAGVSCATMVPGCRALTFTYATSTTAAGTDPAAWGDYTNRLAKVEFTAYDPDLTPTAGMRTVEVAHYAYDSAGRLRAAWDPRFDWTDTGVTPPVTRHVATTYAYDGNGILTTLTPAGEEPWQFAYTTVPGDSGLGRLATVTRSALSAGTAVSTVVYRVPVSGSGAPYDLSSGQTGRWAQTEAPTDAAAVFPPTQVPTVNQANGTLPSSYEYATVDYLDANGRAVNTADPGGGIETTWYDVYGNTTRTLTPGDRKRALDASGSDTAAVEAALASTLSTINSYSSDGARLLSTVGPEHDVALPAPAGGVVRGRTHTVNTYDQGAPASGGPYNLITSTTSSVLYTGATGTPVDADSRTTTVEYDWTLRSPTVETVDPAGLALTTRTSYDSAGRTVSVTTPAGGTTTDTPSTVRTVYYTAAANATYPTCGAKPQLDGVVCLTLTGGQPGSGPEVPSRQTNYNIYGQVRTVAEKSSTATLRTTTVTYDGAGRARDVVVSAPGLGTDVAKTRTVYDLATGQAVRTQSLDATDVVTAQVIRSYDTLGRLASYTDANGNVSTMTYDLASRTSTVNDGKASRTYTYDGGTERRGLPTQVIDTGAGTMSANYDADGNPTSQSWPGGLTVTTTFNEEATPTSVRYVQTGCGQADCTVYSDSATPNGHGQWINRTSTLSSQRYAYDLAGRLTTVNDTVSNVCTTRVYAFAGTSGRASNRTSLTSYAANPNGTCQATDSPTTRSYGYDTADRITTSGTVYDSLGRTLTTPAADTLVPSNGNATMTYYSNDMVRTISVGSRTMTSTLDAIASRFRSLTDNASGTAVTRTSHYADDGDSPVWTDEGNGTWTRLAEGLVGLAGIQTGPSASVVWQVTNLHGDLVAGVVAGTPGLSYSGEQTENGQPRNAADIGTRRYGWLGGSKRAADTPGGNILMGARLYNPATGRFGSIDPVAGGNANAYDYCNADAVTCSDVSGQVACHWTSMRNPWFSPYRFRFFRCDFSHWEVMLMLVAYAVPGVFFGVVAAILGFLTAIGCGPCGVIGGIFGLGAALIGAIAFGLGAAYFIFCRRQAGVHVNGVLVISKRTNRPVSGHLLGVFCN